MVLNVNILVFFFFKMLFWNLKCIFGDIQWTTNLFVCFFMKNSQKLPKTPLKSGYHIFFSHCSPWLRLQSISTHLLNSNSNLQNSKSHGDGDSVKGNFHKQYDVIIAAQTYVTRRQTPRTTVPRDRTSNRTCLNWLVPKRMTLRTKRLHPVIIEINNSATCRTGEFT